MPLHLLHAGMWETMQTESSLLRERDLGISLGKHNTDYICKQGQVLVLLFQQLRAPPSSCPRCHQRVPALLCSPEFVWMRIWVFWKGGSSCCGADTTFSERRYGRGPLGSSTRGIPAAQPPRSRAGGRMCTRTCAHSRTHQAGGCQNLLWTISAECFYFSSLTHSSHLMRIWGFLLSSHLGSREEYFLWEHQSCTLHGNGMKPPLISFIYSLKSWILQNTGKWNKVIYK